jgi:Predicted metalloprotease
LQGYPAPGTFYQPPRRPSPLRGLLFAAFLAIGVVIFAISVLSWLSEDVSATDYPDATSSSASWPTSEDSPSTEPSQQPTTDPGSADDEIGPPDYDPSDLPTPDTYAEATAWLQKNPVYRQAPAIPTDCALSEIDMTKASRTALENHLNELTACLVKVWRTPLATAGFELPRPPVTVYNGAVTTKCGRLDDINAVYCSADQQIYYSTQLWKIFPADQQKDRFVVETVLAHEFGHTIQARTGILISSMAWEQRAEEQDSSSAANVYSRRLEVQADCFSGMFSHAVAQSSGLSSRELTNLREVIYNLGDDVLTGQAGYDGDHGSGKARKTWFTNGQAGTSMAACNTYTASEKAVR